MSYKLPSTGTSTIGIMFVGSGLTATDGVVSVDSGSILDLGYFYSTVTQTNPVANAINIVTFSNTGLSQGITLVSGTRLTVSKTANYTITSIIQYDKTAGGSASIDIWLRKNGVDVGNSNINTTITANGAANTAASNYTLAMNAGDYLELVWQGSSTGAELLAVPAQIGPVRPASPSARTTIVQL